MSLYRNLTNEYLDHLYRTSVAYQYGRFALALKYDMVPDEVLHAAKRCLLDAIGCMVGALDSPGYPMIEGMVRELGGQCEATVAGSGFRTTAANATLVNSFLVRFLDFNDCGGGGHNSDTIPGILAVAEKQKASGKDFLLSLILSYELGHRFFNGSNPPFESENFTMDIRAGVTLPPCYGRLMGLDAMQIANAIGICASHSLPLGILDTNKEANFHAKNLRVGFVARDAIEACMLAKRGFTGPVRVVEGEHGLLDAVIHTEMNIDKMLDWSGWILPEVRFKELCCNLTTMGTALASIENVTKNDIKPRDISKVVLYTGEHESVHTTSLPKKYPLNAETADHSAYFINAVAIRDRKYTVESMNEENFTDPVILDLINKITVKSHPEIPAWGRAGICEITTTDGRVFCSRVNEPYGFGGTLHTDADLEVKFDSLVSRHFPDSHIAALKDTIWNIEKFEDIGKLTRLLIKD